jgi:hypothetical protein
VRRFFPEAEALIAFLHQLDDFIGRQLVALRLRQAAPYAMFPTGAMDTTAVTAAALVLRKERRFG